MRSPPASASPRKHPASGARTNSGVSLVNTESGLPGGKRSPKGLRVWHGEVLRVVQVRQKHRAVSGAVPIPTVRAARRQVALCHLLRL